MKAILNDIINLNRDQMLAYAVANNVTSARLVDMIYDCEAEKDSIEKKLEDLEKYYEYDCDCGGYWIDSTTQEKIDNLTDRVSQLDSFMQDAEEVSNILENKE